jgi:hypothetical protein
MNTSIERQSPTVGLATMTANNIEGEAELDAMILVDSVETKNEMLIKGESTAAINSIINKGTTLEGRSKKLNPNRVNNKDSTDIQEQDRFKVGEDKNLTQSKIKDKIKSNPELSKESLGRIVNNLNSSMSEDEILKVIKQEYTDVFLIHDVIEFVLDLVPEEQQIADDSIGKKLSNLKEKFEKDQPRAIQIGKATIESAKEFAETGLETPKEMRKWYRDTIDTKSGDLKTSELFFKMLGHFGVLKLIQATHYYMKVIASAFNQIVSVKGGMDPIELFDRVNQMKKFQAYVDVLRNSRDCIRVCLVTIERFNRTSPIREALPSGFDFQNFAKTFMNIAQNRYLTKDIISQIVRAQLGLTTSDYIIALVTQQMSLMVDKVDPDKIFLSINHKNEVKVAFKQTLEELYSNLEQIDVQSLQDSSSQDSWIDASILPEDLIEELPTADQAQRLADNFEKDPRIEKFMEAFSQPVQLEELGPDTKKIGD